MLWFPFLAWLSTLLQNDLRLGIRNNASHSGFACFSSSGSLTCRRGSVYCKAGRASDFPVVSQLIVAKSRFLRVIYMGTASTGVPTFQIEYKNSH